MYRYINRTHYKQATMRSKYSPEDLYDVVTLPEGEITPDDRRKRRAWLRIWRRLCGSPGCLCHLHWATEDENSRSA